jgi:hypothetical protein
MMKLKLARWVRKRWRLMMETREGRRRVREAAAAGGSDVSPANPFTSQPKLGFLHVPKSGGTSLTASLNAAFGLEPVHVAGLAARTADGRARDPTRFIEEGTMAYVLARNMPFLAGHVTCTALKGLRREFIFTVLRDPRERVVSMFTYSLQRAHSATVVRRHPDLERFKDRSFVEYMQQQPGNNMALYLLGDLTGWDKVRAPRNRQRPASELHDFIDAGLRRLDVIYACSNQEVLDDLHRRGLVPRAEQEVRENVSEGKFAFGDVGSRQNFLELLDAATWLDRLVYERAGVMFPRTVRRPMVGDEAFLAQLERRFGFRIPA